MRSDQLYYQITADTWHLGGGRGAGVVVQCFTQNSEEAWEGGSVVQREEAREERDPALASGDGVQRSGQLRLLSSLPIFSHGPAARWGSLLPPPSPPAL